MANEVPISEARAGRIRSSKTQIKPTDPGVQRGVPRCLACDSNEPEAYWVKISNDSIIEAGVPEAWWHTVSRVYPYKTNFFYCANANKKERPLCDLELQGENCSCICFHQSHSNLVHKSGCPLKKEDSKPSVPQRIDMWMDNLAHRLKKDGHVTAELVERGSEGTQLLGGADDLREAAEDYRREHVFKKIKGGLTQDRVNFHLKSIAGRLLTLMEAMYGAAPTQCEAMKTQVKKEFRTQFNRVFNELHADGGVEDGENAEDRAARELNIWE